MTDDLINRPLATSVMIKGPWPRQVARVMAIAMADLGVENFSYIGDLEEDGGDFDKGCFVRECRAGKGIKRITDGGLGTRWCVGVEYADKVAFTSVPCDPWKQIDAFTDRVLSIPGWRSYPTLPSCKCGATSHWIRLHGPNGGYGGGIQAYFIWDEGVEKADLDKRAEKKPTGTDPVKEMTALVALERDGVREMQERLGKDAVAAIAKAPGGQGLIDRWISNGRVETRNAIAKEAATLLMRYGYGVEV